MEYTIPPSKDIYSQNVFYFDIFILGRYEPHSHGITREYRIFMKHADSMILLKLTFTALEIICLYSHIIHEEIRNVFSSVMPLSLF